MAKVWEKGTQETKDRMAKMRAARGQNKPEKKKIASVQARRDLREKLLRLEGQLQKALHPVYESESRLDKAFIQTQIREVKAQLDRVSPGAETVSVANKNAIYKRVKELEEQIKVGMPTVDEMMGRAVTIRGNPVGGRREDPGIVQKSMEWEERNESKIREWKQLQRRLDPNDPDIANIENLRKVGNSMETHLVRSPGLVEVH